jgi:hypothetical protein
MPIMRNAGVKDALGSTVLVQAISGINRCLPDLPKRVRFERMVMARNLLMHTCAEHEGELAEHGPRSRSSWPIAAEGLIDAIVGLWQAPVHRAQASLPHDLSSPWEKEPMSDTLTGHAGDAAANIPDYPMARAAGCPLAPAPVTLELNAVNPPSRVRIWDGSTPWLITGYDAIRSLFAGSRASVDDRKPGYPHWNKGILATVHKRCPHGEWRRSHRCRARILTRALRNLDSRYRTCPKS